MGGGRAGGRVARVTRCGEREGGGRRARAAVRPLPLAHSHPHACSLLALLLLLLPHRPTPTHTHTRPPLQQKNGFKHQPRESRRFFQINKNQAAPPHNLKFSAYDVVCARAPQHGAGPAEQKSKHKTETPAGEEREPASIFHSGHNFWQSKREKKRTRARAVGRAAAAAEREREGGGEAGCGVGSVEEQLPLVLVFPVPPLLPHTFFPCQPP